MFREILHEYGADTPGLKRYKVMLNYGILQKALISAGSIRKITDGIPVRNQGRPFTLKVFDQVWTLTPSALDALGPCGIRTKKELKAVIVSLASSKGLDKGVHEAVYGGVELTLTVSDDQVEVRDKYATD